MSATSEVRVDFTVRFSPFRSSGTSKNGNSVQINWRKNSHKSSHHLTATEQYAWYEPMTSGRDYSEVMLDVDEGNEDRSNGNLSGTVSAVLA